MKGLRTPREFDFGGQWDLITELIHEWGKRLLEGTKKTLCTPGPRRKEQWPYKRLSQTCLWVSRSLWHGTVVVCCRVGALSVAVHAQDVLKEVAIIFITSTIVWPQVKWALPINRKLDERFTEHGLTHQNKTQFPAQSLPSGSFHKPLILLIRGQTEWKPQSQRTNQSDHSLV